MTLNSAQSQTDSGSYRKDLAGRFRGQPEVSVSTYE
jgi:hypothetical protein